MRSSASNAAYVGRLAPSPTGYLHLGHARTFLCAGARASGGVLLLRNDDLDRDRCRPEFVAAFREDLHWLGLVWQEPMITQSERLSRYQAVLVELQAGGWIYPCHRSRRDVASAASAPHEGAVGDEPVFPAAWRPDPSHPQPPVLYALTCNWRFRVPDGERLEFIDQHLGPQSALAGVDFGDFLVWRREGWPSYQLASAVDDWDFGVTEIVRGADLVRSSFRQMLLWRALRATVPAFFHCPLVTDASGQRLAKRHDALAVRTLRAQGFTPADLAAASPDLLFPS